jgi:hypothetical protein
MANANANNELFVLCKREMNVIFDQKLAALAPLFPSIYHIIALKHVTTLAIVIY